MRYLVHKILKGALLAGLVLMLSGTAQACFLHVITFKGFVVDHPGALTVAMATRKAVEEGLLAPMPEDVKGKMGSLYRVRMYAMPHVKTLGSVPAGAPPVYVLLTQSGTWVHFSGESGEAVYHSDPAPEGAAVVLLPDLAYEGLIRGQLTLTELETRGLVRYYNDEGSRAQAFWREAISTPAAEVASVQPAAVAKSWGTPYTLALLAGLLLIPMVTALLARPKSASAH